MFTLSYCCVKRNTPVRCGLVLDSLVSFFWLSLDNMDFVTIKCYGKYEKDEFSGGESTS